MRYEQKLVLSQAMASSGNSSIIDLRNVIDLSLQFTTSSAAAPTGTVAVLFANDCTVGPTGIISGGNFGADPVVTNPVVTANGTKMLNVLETGHLFCQVQYTNGTGTGNLNVTTGTKGA